MPVVLMPSARPAPAPAAPVQAPHGRTPQETAHSRHRLSSREIEAFTRNLETQLEAGVPLARALEVQAEHAESPNAAALARGLLQHLHGGLGLGDALDLYPRTFSSVYRSLVRAGEQSGRLPLMLGELAEFQAWREDVRKTVQRAALYPAIVLAATVGLLLLIVGYVLPKFGDLFARLGEATPLAARFLLATGNFLAGHCWQLVGLATVGLLAALVLARSTRVRRQVYRAATRLPLVGRVLAAIDLARLTRTLAILTGAGIPLVRGLELSREAVGDARTMAELAALSEAVVGGQTLAQAAGGSRVFPPIALSLLAVGEEAGQMPAMLDRLAKNFDRAAREAVQRALAMLEPAFTLFLGVVVGGLALVVITTLYKTMMVAGK
ncbi:MAG: type II secretion system F family protein [Planctomycetota bacterium]